MKVLYSVNGIGVGHATRSLAVANAFKRSKILFVSFSEGYNFLKKFYNAEKIYWFDMAGKFSVEVFGTFMKIVSSAEVHKKSKEKMKKIIETFEPDVIISDTEIVALDIGHSLGIPTFSISNLYSVNNNYNKIPKELKTSSVKIQKKVVDEFNRYISKRSNIIFYPSFDLVIKHSNKVKVTDLIVRKKPKKLTYKKKIYVTVGGSKIEKPVVNNLVKNLSKIKDYEFIIAGYNKNLDIKNLHLRTFVDPFKIIPNVNGIITTAGHSSLSEALVYKKPVLAIPIINHVEQLSNAYAIKDLGIGDVLLMKDLRLNYSNEIIEFLKNLEYFKDEVKKLPFNGYGANEIVDYISWSI